ncbi:MULTISPECIES: phage recombination protein Bet [unclassified Brenneria]|uniref:phage recombination protein Bet n=1 Tax=unclassified Brenneria TaxID=2634434 RepID=UPI001551B396|nr:phage recombination protein Bet [Brenneria sp. HEZEL_4_2_4]NPC99456.1 phage recombination protein Bet [Brenneria sp. hezel4-2-4]
MTTNNAVSTLPQAVIALGIDDPTWNALKNSIYPGARDDSVIMAVSYCRARNLDPLMKPVHLVPMNVKDAQSGQYGWRDVVMPGIGLYRIQAERSGSYAGAEEPEFGPDVTKKFGNVEITFPSWCKYTVRKQMLNGYIAEYSAKEYWLENYATAGKDTDMPNAMWKKRPYGQLAKCAEAQALRKAWPEIGQQPTAEEMEGKDLDVSGAFNAAKDVTPKTTTTASAALPNYPSDRFNEYLPQWQTMMESGKKSAEQIIAMTASKYTLSEEQKLAIKDLEPIHAHNS